MFEKCSAFGACHDCLQIFVCGYWMQISSIEITGRSCWEQDWGFGIESRYQWQIDGRRAGHFTYFGESRHQRRTICLLNSTYTKYNLWWISFRAFKNCRWQEKNPTSYCPKITVSYNSHTHNPARLCKELLQRLLNYCKILQRMQYIQQELSHFKTFATPSFDDIWNLFSRLEVPNLYWTLLPHISRGKNIRTPLLP